MRMVFTCSFPDCGRTYVNSSILKRHIQAVHSSIKRFECMICQKCLASRQNLKEHMYIHTKEKPYKCPFPGCSATFRQGTHLSTHKRTEHPAMNGPLSDLALTRNGLGQNSYIINLSYLSRKLQEASDGIPELRIEQSPQRFDLPQIQAPYICKLRNIFS